MRFYFAAGVLTVLLMSCSQVFAASATTRAASRPSVESKEAVKDGLSFKVLLINDRCGSGQQPEFVARFTNIAEWYINLYGVDEYWDWKVSFTNTDKTLMYPGPWQLRLEAAFDKHHVASKSLKPADSIEVPVDLNNPRFPFDFVYEGDVNKPIAPIKSLRPGTYRMVVEVQLRTDPHDDKTKKYWTGPITSEPIEFKVVDSPSR